MTVKRQKVAIVMGSKSDETTMAGCEEMLTYFNIDFETYILSAHRTPDQTAKFAKEAANEGFAVVIAAAGMAAHLPGVIASHTILPVIGVPLASSALGGVDALYSIVQMPKGVPVATMAVGKAGAGNAAIFAAQILASHQPEIAKKLRIFKSQGCKL